MITTPTVGSQNHMLLLCPFDRAGVGDIHDPRIRAQGGVGGKPEEVVDAAAVAPFHDFGPTVMAIAGQSDVGCGPVAANMAHQTPDMASHLRTGGRLAGPQQHGDRPACCRVVLDVSRPHSMIEATNKRRRKA